MSLIKCKECGRQISESAKACPNCGYAPRKTSLFTWIITIFLAIGIIPTIISSFSHYSSMTSDSNQTNALQVTETPEHAAERQEKNAVIQKEIAAQKQKKDEAIQKATIGAIGLKKVMRDPEGFKLESALVIQDTSAVCYDYRAKNGFGGVNVGHAVLSVDGKKFKTNEEDGFSKLWNKECANKVGTEVGTAIRWFAL